MIKNVIETTHRLTKVMGTPNKLAQALRDAVIPMVSRLAPFQHAFVQRLSELGIAYPDSPIVEGPGTRYLDESMRNGGIRSRFLLMVGENAKSETREADRRIGESLPDVLEVRAARRPGLTLVRPDGYVAYTSEAGGAGALASIRGLLERQTSPRPQD